MMKHRYWIRSVCVVGVLSLATACSSSKKGRQAALDPSLDDLEETSATDVVPRSFSEKLSSEDLVDEETPETIGPRPETYKVKAGDTLMKIAFKMYGDISKWKAIYEENKDKLPKPSILDRGLELKLPEDDGGIPGQIKGEKYRIKAGDSLVSIARELYGKTKKWKKLWQKNKRLIKDPNRIFAGFNLFYVLTPQEIAERDAIRAQQPPAPEASQGQFMDGMGQGMDGQGQMTEDQQAQIPQLPQDQLQQLAQQPEQPTERLPEPSRLPDLRGN